MSNPTLSIIIPVYNSSKYLEECVNSILSQTYGDFELILIDDGSTDNSLGICKSFQETDKRIRIKSVLNGGPAWARNHGLDMARGKYVMFIDSDDWIDPGSLSELMSEIKSDLLYFGMKTVYADGHTEPSYPVTAEYKFIDKDTEIDSTIASMLNPNCDVAGFVGNKIFSNHIIQEHHLRFDTSMRLGEDAVFSAYYWNHITSLQLSPAFPYNYRVLDTSITRNAGVAGLHLTFARCLHNMIDDIKRPLTRNAHLTKTFWAYYRHLSYNLTIFNKIELREAAQLLLRFYGEYKPDLGYQGRYLKYIFALPTMRLKSLFLMKYIRFITH